MKVMSALKNDWQLFSDKKYNIIRDNEFTIISSDVADYHTAKKILRCREMYELIEKLLFSKIAGEPIEPILNEIEQLKFEIDKI
jgi:hypothetical protein